MKISLEALEHWGFVVAMVAFAFIAYADYSRDGDRISLALGVVMAVLAILATKFRFFHKREDKEERSET